MKDEDGDNAERKRAAITAGLIAVFAAAVALFGIYLRVAGLL